MSPLLADGPFRAWSGQHLVLILITLVGAVGVVWWGRRHRGTPRELVARRAFAAVNLVITVGMQIYWLTPDVRTPRNSWPLQLSDLADYTAVFALWTRGRRTSAFTYYVGLTFTLMAVLTPTLTENVPDPRWFGFWARHILVVWAAAYLTWGLGIRPSWRVYRSTVVALLVWAVVAYTFNVTMGTNYGYLVDTPASATPLDLLGPWPWYVLGALAVILAVWAVVLTLPWTLAGRRTRRQALGPGSASAPPSATPPHAADADR